MSAYTSTIQKMYVAFFNRPADFNGLLNWEAFAAGKTEAALVSQIAKEFSKAAEYTIVFKGMEYSQIVTKIYNNLLNRDPDLAGLTNWVNHLVKGTSTIDSLVTDILTVAGADDLKTINNKVTAATAFTNALDTVAEANAYSGAAANAVAAQWLATVGTDASLAAATTPAALTAVTASVLSNSGNALGTTFTLTSGIDTLTGTANNDTFIADSNTASAADQVNGGAGTDTLKLFGVGAANVPTMTSIEKVFVSGATAGLNLATNDVLSELTLSNLAGSHTHTITGGGVKFKLEKSATAQSTVIAGFTGATADLTLDAAGGTGVVQTLDLRGTAMTTVQINSTNSTGTAGNNLAFSNTTGLVKTVNVAGDRALTLDLTGETSVTSVVSGLTAGGLTANVQGLTLEKATGAEGNDSFLFGTTAVGNTVINGGAGTDVVGVNAANTAALFASNKIESIETVRVQDAFVVDTATAGYTNAFDLSKVKGATNVTFSGDVTVDSTSAAKTLTVSNIASNGTVTLAGDLVLAAGTAAGAVIAVKDAGLSNTDVLNLALTKTGATNAVGGFTANGVETLNIDVKNGAATNVSGVVDAQLQAIKLTSSLTNNGVAGTITLDSGNVFDSTIINNVDASGYNGAVTLTNLANNLVASGATIKGGAGLLTATGTSGIDTIVAGKGGLSYTLAGGSDAIDLAASTAAVDTIVVAAGTSASTAFAKVTGFQATASNADVIDTVTAAVIGNVAAGTVSGITNVTYGITNGVVTFAGTGLASATASQLIDAVLSSNIANTSNNVVAFEFGGNTYVVDADGTAGTSANDIVVQLVGLTGVTAVGTAAAANTIVIA